MTTMTTTTTSSSSSSSQNNNHGRRSTYSFQKQEKDTPVRPKEEEEENDDEFYREIRDGHLERRVGIEARRRGIVRDRVQNQSGNAVYIEGFHCEEDDFQTLEQLAEDLDNTSRYLGSTSKRKEEEEEDVDGGFEGGVVNWSKHLKQENPEFSETFRTVVNEWRRISTWMSTPRPNPTETVGLETVPSRFACSANGRKEDFTMGASFGAQRALSFLHEPSASSFEFPQKNGDVFAFSSEVNARDITRCVTS